MKKLNDKDNKALSDAVNAFLKEKDIIPPDNCQMVAVIKDGKIVDVKFVSDAPKKLQ